jgi:acetyl-CoA carboxylase, biotin carboxylase subunit
MADRYGNVIHLGERDCTVQRNHQKLIEESPSPGARSDERARTLAAAVARDSRRSATSAPARWSSCSTQDGTLRFMEMNTRLQVEHCVSEMRSGIDLVDEQIRVAAGHPLRWTQDDVTLTGHAIECRINAEDPERASGPRPARSRAGRAPAATGRSASTPT